MKKQIILSTAAVLLLLTGCSTDFRSSSWGDSMEQVKRSEEAQDWQQSDSPDGTQSAIYFEGQVHGLSAIIFFAFEDNQLIWGKHEFTQEHDIPHDYYTDYITVNSSLKDKFGMVQVDHIFSTDRYKEDPEQWGEAILQGDLLVQTRWENENSEIRHVILGDQGQILHAVEYQSIPAPN
jgi:hypothetical protein